VLAFDPDNVHALSNLTRYVCMSGRVDEAEHWAERLKAVESDATDVWLEVVMAGARYPDAQAARRRIDRGQIMVLSPPPNPALETLLAPYGLGNGEHDSILLVEHADLYDAILVLDDHLAYLVSDRLVRRQRFLLDVIADLAGLGKLDKSLAMEIIKTIRTRYPPAFVEHTLILLRR